MKRLRLAMCVYAMLTATGAAAAETAAVILPLALLNKAHQAGSDIETVEFVDSAHAGLFDRDSGPTLRIGRTAYDLTTTPEEKEALLAIVLSRRIGISAPTRADAAQPDDPLQNVIAGGLDANGARHDRPATPRRRQVVADNSPPRGDQTILRGVAWARAAGVCEKISVALLDRLATGAPKGGAVAGDARAARKALGLLRFSPDERC